MTSLARSGKPKRSIESLQVERRYRNVLTLFLSGQLPHFDHTRHVHVANILTHLPYGRELMHLGLQVMAYRHFIPDKYSAEITDRDWDQLDGTLPDPAVFTDLPGVPVASLGAGRGPKRCTSGFDGGRTIDDTAGFVQFVGLMLLAGVMVVVIVVIWR